MFTTLGRLVFVESVAISLVCCTHCVALAVERPTSIADVVVRKMDAEVPKDEEQAREFLWNNFANKPEEARFRDVRSKNWKATFKEYRQALLKKAKAQSLDDKALDRCLEMVLRHALAKEGKNDGYAYLPVGAYLAKQGEAPIWILVVKWEFDMSRDPYQMFGHVRMFAIDAKSFRIVGFSTCD